MIKKDYEEIWIWHKHIEAYHASGMGQKEFCDAYNVEYKRFCNMRYRIDYKRDSDPDLYRKLTGIARKYMESGLPSSKFAKDNGVDIRKLSEAVTHLGYIDIIEKMKIEKEEAPMKFVQIPSVGGSQPRPPMVQESEVLEKQNDIEIIITKGVKVSISPNIDSMKIIKIIELLKDL